MNPDFQSECKSCGAPEQRGECGYCGGKVFSGLTIYGMRTYFSPKGCRTLEEVMARIIENDIFMERDRMIGVRYEILKEANTYIRFGGDFAA